MRVLCYAFMGRVTHSWATLCTWTSGQSPPPWLRHIRKAVSAPGHCGGRLLWDPAPSNAIGLGVWFLLSNRRMEVQQPFSIRRQNLGLHLASSSVQHLPVHSWSSDSEVHLKCRVSGLTCNPLNQSVCLSRILWAVYAREKHWCDSRVWSSGYKQTYGKSLPLRILWFETICTGLCTHYVEAEAWGKRQTLSPGSITHQLCGLGCHASPL